ncbi:MAG: hypothetical protein PHI23_02970 [Candidatus Peribacteraceae bacterium]|nr:hypothetical protein [Candidatus Peribacteraceae bacterium]
MKRHILSWTIASLAVLTPLCTFAAFERPSDLFLSLQSEGKPQEFDMKFFAKVDLGDEEGMVTIGGSVNGMSEGKKADEVKMFLHSTINAEVGNEGSIRGDVDMQIFQGMLYLRLNDLQVTSTDAALKEFLSPIVETWKGKWLSTDMMAELQKQTSGDSLQSLIDLNELDMSPEELAQSFTTIFDAIFQMEHTRFREGHAYLLTLKPDFWAEALSAYVDVIAEIEPELADSLLEEDILPTLATGSEYYLDGLNVRIKVDTNNEDQFRFAKYYASLDLPEDGIYFAVEGKTQHRPKPVYLEIPKQPVDLEEAIQEIFGTGFETEEWEEEFPEEGGTDIWEYEGEGVNEWEDWSDDEETQWVPPEEDLANWPKCTAEPGTKEYLQLSRKGECPILWRNARSLHRN